MILTQELKVQEKFKTTKTLKNTKRTQNRQKTGRTHQKQNTKTSYNITDIIMNRKNRRRH